MISRRAIDATEQSLDGRTLAGLDEPIVALNMGTGGGQTNLGDDTSAQEGTPNDF